MNEPITTEEELVIALQEVVARIDEIKLNGRVTYPVFLSVGVVLGNRVGASRNAILGRALNVWTVEQKGEKDDPLKLPH